VAKRAAKLEFFLAFDDPAGQNALSGLDEEDLVSAVALYVAIRLKVVCD